MTSYLELHMELERRRGAAKASGSPGPRVLVAGPTDTGKSSLCRLLANYLTRCGNSTTLVDLDFAQGEMCVPGSVSAVPIHRPLDIEVSAPPNPLSGAALHPENRPALSARPPRDHSEGPRRSHRSSSGTAMSRRQIAWATCAASWAASPLQSTSVSSTMRRPALVASS